MTATELVDATQVWVLTEGTPPHLPEGFGWKVLAVTPEDSEINRAAVQTQ